MPPCFVIIFLGLVLQKSCSLAEATEQGNRCDKTSVVTIRTPCVPCSAVKVVCPPEYTKIINESVVLEDCRYRYPMSLLLHSLSVPRCRYTCHREDLLPQCCPGYWGPDCLECPGGAQSPCSGRGSCADGIEGNGSCSCQEGFGGTACEVCAQDNLFGPNCSSVCTCVHGVCKNGPQGDGTCDCYSAYTGSTCDTPIPECAALLCPENSRCSPLSKDKTKLECQCLPNYRGSGQHCEPINPCLEHPCSPHAHCTYLGPNRHSCTCGQGYTGDGRVCIPVDPCQIGFGNCHPRTTQCKYDGPGQSHCECKEHYHGFVPGVGCSMTDLCKSKNPCHRKANCTMVEPGQTQCTCQKGYVGDGFTCYGSIMEQIQELNTTPLGKWQGRLTSFILLLDKVYAWPLSALGPFTLLLPLEQEPKAFSVEELLMDPTAARQFAKLHIIAGQMSTEEMNNTDTFYTLTGAPGWIFNRDKDNQLKLKLHAGKKKVKIIEGNIIASNGLIHILDTAMDKIKPTFEGNSEKTIMALIPPRYSRFRALLEQTNLQSALDEDGAGGPYTIFLPSNEGLNNMKYDDLHFLLSPEGSQKLLEFVRYHIVPSTQLEVATLISTLQIRTMANQIIWFNITNNGQILANDVAVKDTEVTAKNGHIYTLAGVLLPPSIIPILPHRCDETKSEMKPGSCVNCILMSSSNCPAGSEPMELFTRSCIYSTKTKNPRGGCARYCNSTVRVPKCCQGFYGPDCRQCPGGFLSPCSGNGQCADGISGNGTCICKDGFYGSHCQFCSDPNKYGPRCEKKCLCSMGTCDNSVHSDGACLQGTCRGRSWGKYCDVRILHCGYSAHTCHVHAICEYKHNLIISCVCKDGYEGNGLECSEKDPCADSTRGGCSRNAVCVKTGPGKHICVCQPGWTGSGRDCMEINPCLLPSRGGCHSNATCLYVGPGQNQCECRKGFRGNGVDCEPIVSCLEQPMECHPLATCQIAASGLWSCVCRDGYKGDGHLCFGDVAMELSFLSEAATFYQWTRNASLQSLLSTSSNLTILVPSQQAIEDMDRDEKNFWLSKSHIPVLIKYHMLLGTFSVTDLQSLPASETLATSLQGSFLHLQKADGSVTIGGAAITSGDNVATNGVIHIINKVLVPPRNSSLPNLLTQLSQMPDYSIFQGYITQYELESVIEAADAYTVFAPNNAAIKHYMTEKKIISLEEDTLSYHVILDQKLLKNDLHNGMHRETMLGPAYLLGFFLRSDQLYVNEVPINYTNVATDKGVIYGLGKVLEIQKNRCDSNETTIVRGKCDRCPYPPVCPPGTKILGKERNQCIYTMYFMGKRSVFIGCRPTCMRVVITRACCAGFFGEQCQACPRQHGDVCFGHGVCMDGVNGTGVCKCDPGFSGTACETCVDGQYGVHCDQACSCVHGRCNQGPSGDGSCECDVGWQGVKCDSAITEDNCNGRCHTSANCLLQPDGTASCRCAAGFQGNGTICKAINPCETQNGGCSLEADCKRTTPGSRVCICKAGYIGDGIVCLEINPCLENHGGCDRNAECTHTGPNQAVCNCLPTYTGDGKACTSINVCLTKNGGCSPNAICKHNETGERTCICKQNYVGDGLTCRGSIYEELPKDPQTSQYFFQLQEHEVRELAEPGPFTVFAPASAAFNKEPQIKDWDRQGLMSQILRYHIVSCHQLLLENIKLTPNVTSLQGEPIIISVSQDTVYINKKAKVISSNIISTNGVVHIIDRLLSPQNLLVTPRDTSGRVLHNLTTVATMHGYSRFSTLLQDSGLLSFITNPIHTPITLFWPTDRALQALPQKQQDFLFSWNSTSKDKLMPLLKFHVIRDAKVFAVDLPRSSPWKTMQGSKLSVKCGAGSHIGELFLNGQMCRIVQRELLFDLGVAYGIDCLLMEPTLGRRCDTFTVFKILGECRSCLSAPTCPRLSKPKGMEQTCFYQATRDGPLLEGCLRHCFLVSQVPSCCKGYFLPDCQACPGGPDTPCNNRGICHPLWSLGRCHCNDGFNGTACELCFPGRFGPDCQPCNCSTHGQCDEGISGSGQCLCDSGWTGPSCDTRKAVPPVCIPPCSAHATCIENNTCECKLGYEGDGITCTVVDFCKQNNGGCAEVAKCSQKGTKVSCRCPAGYQGDGHSCMEIDPCADGLNGGCHEQATCMMTGPGKRKCECKSHYVGDGLDCEPENLPLDRCLQNNGFCHPQADCVDLHFQDTTLGVFHVRSYLGQYMMTYDDAMLACSFEDAVLATYNQLSYAQKAGYHLCSAGWLKGRRVAYPTTFASPKCGGNAVGIVDYGVRPNTSETWDAFCYRMQEVNCTCKMGYVGDGFMCSGNLLQVLMSFPLLKDFLTEVLAYSNSSAQGQAFLKHLTDPSTNDTLFVPHNSILIENKTLSGRDIEHHLVTVNKVFFSDLVNGTVLQTRLGSQLLITSGRHKQYALKETFVDGRAIVLADILATNGIVHVISRPLKAPPAPETPTHTGLGTGIFFIIILVIGAIALAAYSYFRLSRRAIGFQHFEPEEDITVAVFSKQFQDNISNPVYESTSAMPPPPPSDPEELDNSDPPGAEAL